MGMGEIEGYLGRGKGKGMEYKDIKERCRDMEERYREMEEKCG